MFALFVAMVAETSIVQQCGQSLFVNWRLAMLIECDVWIDSSQIRALLENFPTGLTELKLRS
jgi:hypothetical protein